MKDGEGGEGRLAVTTAGGESGEGDDGNEGGRENADERRRR